MLENANTWLKKLSQDEGKISQATYTQDQQNVNETETKKGAKFLKVLIKSADGDKVNIKIPFTFAKLLLNVHPKILEKTSFNKADIDFKEIISSLETGVYGELLDIESNDGDIVKIIVE